MRKHDAAAPARLCALVLHKECSACAPANGRACVSLHQPFSSIGRSGRSTSRATNTSASFGLPSRFK